MRTPRCCALVAVLASSVVLAGCAASAPTAPDVAPSSTASATTGPELESELVRVEQRYGALLGVAALDTGTGRRVTHRAEERFAFASTNKTFIAAATLQQATSQDLDAVVSYDEDDLLVERRSSCCSSRRGAPGTPTRRTRCWPTRREQSCARSPDVATGRSDGVGAEVLVHDRRADVGDLGPGGEAVDDEGVEVDKLRRIRDTAARAEGVEVADTPRSAQSTRVSDEYLTDPAARDPALLEYGAISLLGPRKAIGTLVGSLCLL